MNLDEVQASAERTLSESDNPDAHKQAKNVLGILHLVADAAKDHAALKSSINGELAQLRAEKSSVKSMTERAMSAEKDLAKLKSAFTALTKKHLKLTIAVKDLQDGHAAREAAESHIGSALTRLKEGE